VAALLCVATASEASTCATAEGAGEPAAASSDLPARPGPAGTCPAPDEVQLAALASPALIRTETWTGVADPAAAATAAAGPDWTAGSDFTSTAALRGSEEHSRMTPTPLPGSAWLLVSGFAGLAAARRRPRDGGRAR
jgi:hypothetical protein